MRSACSAANGVGQGWVGAGRELRLGRTTLAASSYWLTVCRRRALIGPAAVKPASGGVKSVAAGRA